MVLKFETCGLKLYTCRRRHLDCIGSLERTNWKISALHTKHEKSRIPAHAQAHHTVKCRRLREGRSTTRSNHRFLAPHQNPHLRPWLARLVPTGCYAPLSRCRSHCCQIVAGIDGTLTLELSGAMVRSAASQWTFLDRRWPHTGHAAKCRCWA